MNIDAYFESLILDAVGQTDAPLHEALVRSSVYRTINESYERALAQLVKDGELLYANGEYGLAPDAAKPAEPEAVEPDAVESEAAETEALERAAAAPWADEADMQSSMPLSAIPRNLRLSRSQLRSPKRLSPLRSKPP